MPLTNKSGNVYAEQVEVLDTPLKRSRGLLKYKEAPQQYAAVFYLPLFGFFPVVHTFGMKFSIDIAFCDTNKKIKHFYPNVAPSSIRAPLKNIWGGCPYMIDFVNCNTQNLRLGEDLEWTAP